MKKDLLLLLPPCDAPHRPGAALPQLAGYLKSRGIPLICLDGNLAFFRHFFREERLFSGFPEGADRIEELGSQKSLAFPEMMEYLSLAKARIVLDMAGEEAVRRSLDPREAMEGHVRSTLFESMAKFLWISRFPESLWNVGEGIFYEAPGSCYSSEEIVECAEGDGIFEDFFACWFSRRLEGYAPPVIGISVTYGGQAIPAFRMARELKKQFPRAFIVLGGAFVTLHLATTRKAGLFRWIDGMITGDGEVPLERLYEICRFARGNLASVPGLLWLEEGQLRRNPPAAPVALETISPEYRFFPKEEYYQDASGEFAGFRLSRGCSWGRCAFCRTEDEFIRHVDSGGDELFEKLRFLVRNRGQRSFAFGDDEADPEMLERFAAWVCREKLDIGWSVNVRADARLTLERCMLFRQAGCRRLVMGVESSNNRLLGHMCKGITWELVERVLSNASWAGIPVGAYMMVGFPSETEEEARRSFETIRECLHRGGVQSVFYSAFQVAPGSSVMRHPERFGISAMTFPEGADLAPPVVDFEAPGMSRQTAFRLTQEFSSRLREERLTSPPHPPEELRFGTKRIPLTFPLRDVAEALRHATPPHVDFIGYLREGRGSINRKH